MQWRSQECRRHRQGRTATTALVRHSGSNTDGFGSAMRKNIDKRMGDMSDSVPVRADLSLRAATTSFAARLVPAPEAKCFDEGASFRQYRSVNHRSADVIVENYREGDMIRDSVLKGVLCADLVGFQYAGRFGQTVSRIPAYESLPKGIQVEGPVAPASTGRDAEKKWNDSAEGRKGKEKGRFVDVGVFPMGIDVKSQREEPEVQYWVQLLRQRYAGMKLIVGRDKLDEIQVGVHLLEAFEHFLKANPEFQGKVVLIQVALQTTESNELAGGVFDVVARINAGFSTLTYQLVVFLLVQEVTFSQYPAPLTVADAFMVTSLREGMALRTHEYVECQEERNRALILSEFTGTYSYSGFRSCFAVNPYDTRGTAKAIYQALTMSDEEAASRKISIIMLSLKPPRHSSPLFSPDASAHTTKWEGPIVELPEDTIRVLESMADDPKNGIWVLSGLPVKGALERLAERVPGPKVGIVAENGCFMRTREIGNKSGGQSNGARWINMVANPDFAWKGPCVEILNYFTERTPGSFVEERATSVARRFWTGPPDSTSPIDDDATTTTNDISRRQAAEAQNHIFDSLGERYGLRIIPGQNSFLVLPNNISRSTAVGTILHPGGPACSPLGGGAGVGDADYDGWWSSTTVGSGTGRTSGTTGGRVSTAGESTLVLGIGGDEKLLRRLNELDDAETVSTSRRGTDTRWKPDPREVSGVLGALAQMFDVYMGLARIRATAVFILSPVLASLDTRVPPCLL
ncbi:glycosyltransferase family 20-domain-containing protein [Pisolithus marmoratus]|nr:glycosyltransferase family 20-domain-containing protein [Pisolithus marmoratus]